MILLVLFVILAVDLAAYVLAWLGPDPVAAVAIAVGIIATVLALRDRGAV